MLPHDGAHPSQELRWLAMLGAELQEDAIAQNVEPTTKLLSQNGYKHHTTDKEARAHTQNIKVVGPLGGRISGCGLLVCF